MTKRWKGREREVGRRKGTTHVEVSLFMPVYDGPFGISEDGKQFRSSKPSSIFELVVEIETDLLGGGGDSEAADPVERNK